MHRGVHGVERGSDVPAQGLQHRRATGRRVREVRLRVRVGRVRHQDRRGVAASTSVVGDPGQDGVVVDEQPVGQLLPAALGVDRGQRQHRLVRRRQARGRRRVGGLVEHLPRLGVGHRQHDRTRRAPVHGGQAVRGGDPLHLGGTAHRQVDGQRLDQGPDATRRAPAGRARRGRAPLVHPGRDAERVGPLLGETGLGPPGHDVLERGVGDRDVGRPDVGRAPLVAA